MTDTKISVHMSKIPTPHYYSVKETLENVLNQHQNYRINKSHYSKYNNFVHIPIISRNPYIKIDIKDNIINKNANNNISVSCDLNNKQTITEDIPIIQKYEVLDYAEQVGGNGTSDYVFTAIDEKFKYKVFITDTNNNENVNKSKVLSDPSKSTNNKTDGLIFISIIGYINVNATKDKIYNDNTYIEINNKPIEPCISMAVFEKEKYVIISNIESCHNCFYRRKEIEDKKYNRIYNDSKTNKMIKDNLTFIYQNSESGSTLALFAINFAKQYLKDKYKINKIKLTDTSVKDTPFGDIPVSNLYMLLYGKTFYRRLGFEIFKYQFISTNIKENYINMSSVADNIGKVIRKTKIKHCKILDLLQVLIDKYNTQIYELNKEPFSIDNYKIINKYTSHNILLKYIIDKIDKNEYITKLFYFIYKNDLFITKDIIDNHYEELDKYLGFEINNYDGAEYEMKI